MIIAILVFAFYTKTNAQQGGKERMKAFKTAYITEELDLTVKEAEKFWPVYNKYDKKLFSLKVEKGRKERHRIKELGGPQNVSDQEATTIVFSMLSAEKEASVTREKMYKDLSKILSPTKLLTLYQAEMNFNKRLLSEYRKRKGN
jgi:DTW domain-containing protein YfiP